MAGFRARRSVLPNFAAIVGSGFVGGAVVTKLVTKLLAIMMGVLVIVVAFFTLAIVCCTASLVELGFIRHATTASATVLFVTT